MSRFEIGYKSYSELKKIGIILVSSKGINDLGLLDKTIVCADGTTWNYNPEDGIYERDYDSVVYNINNN